MIVCCDLCFACYCGSCCLGRDLCVYDCFCLGLLGLDVDNLDAFSWILNESNSYIHIILIFYRSNVGISVWSSNLLDILHSWATKLLFDFNIIQNYLLNVLLNCWGYSNSFLFTWCHNTCLTSFTTLLLREWLWWWNWIRNVQYFHCILDSIDKNCVDVLLVSSIRSDEFYLFYGCAFCLDWFYCICEGLWVSGDK